MGIGDLLSEKNGLVLDTNIFSGSNSLGLWITIVAGICSNLGVQLQKHAHHHRSPNAADNQPYFVDKQWIIGMILVIVGSIGDFEALSFATQSLVATVGGGTTVVTNVLFSTIWHCESFSIRDAYGTFCILLGVILIAICSPQDQQYNVHELLDTFQSAGVLLYLVVLAGIIVYILSIIDEKTSATQEQGQTPASYYQQLAKTSFLHRTNNKIRRFLRVDDQVFCMQPMLYAIVSGIMGSLSMLLGKCASELVKTTFQGQNQFYHPMTYIFFGGMLCTIALQIHWFNQALILGDISIVFPVFQVFWIGFGVIGGMVLYNDLARLEFFQGVSFILAFWCILIGVYNLAQHERHDKNSFFKSTQPILPTTTSPVVAGVAVSLFNLIPNEDDENYKSNHPHGSDNCYFIDSEAYQTLLEATPEQQHLHEQESTSISCSEIQNTYRPPVLLRTL